LDIYLCGQDTVHRQYVYNGVDREWSLDLGTDDLRTFQFKQLFDLVLGGGGALECHVPSSTVCTEVRLVWVLGGENSVLQGGADKAVGLTIPKQWSILIGGRVWKSTHMVSGRKVAATIKTFLPLTFSLTCFSISGFGHETTSILMAVYSWGPKASPSERSWSIHGWPSFGL